MPPDPQGSKPNSLANLLADVSRCVKCGRCLSVCPVFKETGRETEAARGKLSLIESASAEEIRASSKRLKEIVSFCLLCGACAENCPNLVPGDAIIQRARETFNAKDSLSFPLRLAISHILPSPDRMDQIHRTGKIIQPLFMKKVPLESGLYWRFPVLRDKNTRLVPNVAKESFLEKHSSEKSPKHPSAALFVGCVSNYVYPAIAEAAFAILQYLNISVLIPAEQACCGLMAFGTGITEIDRELAKKNIAAFESKDSIPIVAFCSSCSSHLKNYSELFEEGEWKERALKFSRRVEDFSEFLIDEGFQNRSDFHSIDSALRLTFHDPCHLRRKQGIFEQPRNLLKSVKGVEFVETGEENLCCGSGGSFNLSHYDLSLKIFRRRLQSIEKADVDTVVTSCMGCLLQFLDGLYQENRIIRVKHLAEVLRLSLPR